MTCGKETEEKEVDDRSDSRVGRDRTCGRPFLDVGVTDRSWTLVLEFPVSWYVG